jgi:hypothetical protein
MQASSHATVSGAGGRAADLAVELEVDLDGEPFFRRQWCESIPRRLV